MIAEDRHLRQTTVVPPAAETLPVLDSRELFAGRTEIVIAHDGALYRMKITRQNKLILNK